MVGPATAIRSVGWIDPDVVEAACLAHDIGHPPFGHIAEQELQTSLSAAGADSFEGNAQSFRIVTKLAIVGIANSEYLTGLNLTRATLRAILKYPWLYNEPSAAPKSSTKWGAYHSEASEMTFALKGSAPNQRSVEAQIMDWADDITYAVHDIEDFYRFGLIPLHELGTNTPALRNFTKYVLDENPDWESQDPEATMRRLGIFFPSSVYGDSPYDRGELHNFASELITRCFNAVTLSGAAMQIDPQARFEVDLLKRLIWYYVINRPSLAAIQLGQRRIVRDLYDHLKTIADRAETSAQFSMRLPARLRDQITMAQRDRAALASVNGNLSVLRARAVADFIGTLTENQAYALNDLFGGDPAAAKQLPLWLG